jgi:hypothetical protein
MALFRKEPSFQSDSGAGYCPTCGHPLAPDPEPPAILATSRKDRPSVGSQIWGGVILLGIIWFVVAAVTGSQKDEQAEKDYLQAHPLTDKQLAANKHFSDCWNFRHASSAAMSEKQRALLLSIEGCHSDDRDDPRYEDASYPYNANAPQPWKH